MASIDKQSDESLMVRVQDGDHQAFSTLVRRHTNRFYASALRVCRDVREAEDIVQEAFLKLWDKPQSWDSGRKVKFTTWFYRVVHNLAVDHMRRNKPLVSSESLDFMADGKQNQDQELALKQEQTALEIAIQSLPERQKAALNLCVYDGLSNKEAAEVLGVGVKALESLLMRAKSHLRDDLTRQGFIRKDEQYG